MSTLKVSNIQATGETASRAVSGVAAAWVAVNNAPTTLDIENSLNVSSEVDNTTGDYSFNLSNAFTDDWFSQQSTARNNAFDKTTTMNGARVTSSVMAAEVGDAHAQAQQDINIVITAHGDLA